MVTASKAAEVIDWLIDWAGFNVSPNTVQVIWETVLQVKRPNQQYQSTEGNQLKWTTQQLQPAIISLTADAHPSPHYSRVVGRSAHCRSVNAVCSGQTRPCIHSVSTRDAIAWSCLCSYAEWNALNKADWDSCGLCT